jgi:phage-related protein
MGYMPFKWTETVGDDERDFQIYLKSTETPKITQDTLAGLIRPSILSLKAQDPRKYLQDADSITNSGTAINEGTAKTPCIITITASGTTSTSLTITNSTTGESIVVQVALTTGQVLVIDTRLHSVKLNGTERRDYISTDSDWMLLSPGNNVITVTNGSNCSVITSWRSAWPL